MSGGVNLFSASYFLSKDEPEEWNRRLGGSIPLVNKLFEVTAYVTPMTKKEIYFIFSFRVHTVQYFSVEGNSS